MGCSDSAFLASISQSPNQQVHFAENNYVNANKIHIELRMLGVDTGLLTKVSSLESRFSYQK